MDLEKLKRFVPLSSLSDERLAELANISTIKTITPGAYLFHEGDVDNQTMYLVKGEVKISSSSGESDVFVMGGSEEAIHPLADNQPRQHSALAAIPVEVLQVDNSVLDYMITWDQMAEMESMPDEPENEPVEKVEEKVQEKESQQGLNRLSKAMPFLHIPPANMSLLVERMEKVEAKKDDVVIRQGDEGDYYYVLDEGNAKVTRQVDLAELEEGAAFGEEALIAGTKRNASVTMTTDGSLLRLSKSDFDELLKEPLLNWLNVSEAGIKVGKGARWLDVRLGKEFAHGHLPKALNIPLHELRVRMGELDKETNYICYCKTGRRSSAAAFLLSQAGFNVSVLRGGLQVLPGVMKSKD